MTNIGKAYNALNAIDGFEFEFMGADFMDEDTYHRLRHRYASEVIVPYVAITKNVDFIINSRATKHIITADEVKCKVASYEEKHICDLEDDIKRIYKLDAWAFMKRWHEFEPYMTCAHFVKMFLEREDEASN